MKTCKNKYTKQADINYKAHNRHMRKKNIYKKGEYMQIKEYLANQTDVYLEGKQLIQNFAYHLIEKMDFTDQLFKSFAYTFILKKDENRHTINDVIKSYVSDSRLTVDESTQLIAAMQKLIEHIETTYKIDTEFTQDNKLLLSLRVK